MSEVTSMSDVKRDVLSVLDRTLRRMKRVTPQRRVAIMRDALACVRSIRWSVCDWPAEREGGAPRKMLVADYFVDAKRHPTYKLTLTAWLRPSGDNLELEVHGLLHDITARAWSRTEERLDR